MLHKLIFVFTATILAAGLPATAQDSLTSDSCFAHIDSSLYVINSTLPRYTEEVFVGRISPAGYDVVLCYPELRPLSGKEQKLVRELQQSGAVLPDATLDTQGVILAPSPAPIGGLDLQQTMLVDRKQGYLSVSFCPIVRHEGAWKRIISCQVKVSERQPQHTSAPSHVPDAAERWAAQSVLATGKWAKISVKDEGIYQLTAADIQKMGFSDLSKVHVYGYGGLVQNEVLDFSAPDENAHTEQAPDDLVEVPVYTSSDGRLLFWAEGTVRQRWDKTTRSYTHILNTYSTYSAYFVTESNEPRAAVGKLDVPAEIAAAPLTDVPYVTFYDKDVMSWYPGGRRMFDSHDFSTGSTQSYRLATPDLNVNALGTQLVEVATGNTSSISTVSFNVKANGTNLGNFSVSKITSSNEVATVNTGLFTKVTSLTDNGGNVFQITSNNSNKARLDFIRVNYSRHLQLGDTPYSFSPQTDQPVSMRIAGANATTHLWRIGQKDSPTAEVPTQLNVNGELEGVVTAGRRRYVFFDETQTYGTPEYMGEVANQNLHADNGIDYVIIVPTSGRLVAQAERLGELHKQHDGMTYKVVRADQLYNEFSSGTPDASAYRRYLKMLYDRAGDDENAMPRYCLFMGKSSWDNRLITEENKGQSADDYILAFENNDVKYPNSVGSVNSYVSDDFFGLLDDGEGKDVNERLDLALGRLVCTTDEEATLLVDKITAYVNNDDVGSWKNTAVFLGDVGERNGHMEDAERVASIVNEVAPNLNIQKVYWDRYLWTSATTGYTFPQATARIRQFMKEGALLFNYSGHGSPNMISHYKILQTPDFAEATSSHMPVWVLASCEIYPFDSGEDNLAETSLYVRNGGSIAFICATRAVYAERNNVFNKAYCRYALSRDDNGHFYSLGEALRLAKKEIIDNGSDNTVNKLKYICFGDPAIRIAQPTGKVVLDSIDGRHVSEYPSLATLSAGAAVRFSGHVCQPGSSTLDTSFDGNVSTTVYDCSEEITCKYNYKDKEPAPPMVYNERSKSIFKGSTKAEGGKFEFVVSIPRDISYTTKAGRISFYAVSADKSTEYNGYSEKFCLNGTAEMDEPDTKGPEVVAYINSIDNPDYTVTDENPVLIADITDEYGINNAGISLGHDIELVLDGNTSQIYNLNSYFNYDFGSYQRGQLIYEMKGMARGQHTAQLRVWDVNNNATITDVHFIVRSENAEGGKDGYVTATRNPATTSTQFITYFPADASVSGLVHYEVYDTRGRCVFKDGLGVSPNATSSSYSWDLCGNDHQPLPAGIYFYRTVINTSNGSLATDAQKLIITRQ